MTEATRRLPALLAAAGLLCSAWLEAVHVRAYVDPAASSFCSVGAKLDCTTVALSRLSVVLGVPLPIWGMAGFVALGIAANRRSVLLLPLSGFAAVASLLLLVAELTTIHSVCLLCEVVHVLTWAIFGLALRMRASLQPRARRDLLHILGAPGAAVGIASIVVSPYWAVYSWKGDVRLPNGTDEGGHQWIGAESPAVTVHEYVDYACPHCAVSSSRMRRLLAEHPTKLRIVRHINPRMRCPRMPGFVHCRAARAALCAGDQGKFWRADAWLFDHAPGRADVDVSQLVRDLELDGTALKACMESEETFKRADDESRAITRAHILDSPSYVLDGKRYVGSEIFAALRSRL